MIQLNNMLLIIGLGNPGEKYINTRHNIGFIIVDEFVKKNNFSEFKLSKKFNALLSEGFFKDKKLILAKPQTFMNESGKAVKKITTNYKLQTTNLIIVHDDIDLPLGKIRIVKNRGAGGHKGVKSIIKELGTKDFIRFRIGIKPKERQKNAEIFVLQKFNKKEKEIIKKVIKNTVEAIELTLREDLEKSMSKYNK